MRALLLELGDRVRVRLPFSEVCDHMKVEGLYRTVELVGDRLPMAQILNEDGTPFSSPITTGEAGIYNSPQGPYVYVEPGDVIYPKGMYEHEFCQMSTSAWPVDSPSGGQAVEFRCTSHPEAQWSRPLLAPLDS